MLLPYLTAAVSVGVSFAAASHNQAPLVSADNAAEAIHVTHEAHPHHSLSITRHSSANAKVQGEGNRIASVCPGATDGYTGYLNKGDKHFYFA